MRGLTSSYKRWLPDRHTHTHMVTLVTWLLRLALRSVALNVTRDFVLPPRGAQPPRAPRGARRPWPLSSGIAPCAARPSSQLQEHFYADAPGPWRRYHDVQIGRAWWCSVEPCTQIHTWSHGAVSDASARLTGGWVSRASSWRKRAPRKKCNFKGLWPRAFYDRSNGCTPTKARKSAGQAENKERRLPKASPRCRRLPKIAARAAGDWLMSLGRVRGGSAAAAGGGLAVPPALSVAVVRHALRLLPPAVLPPPVLRTVAALRPAPRPRIAL